jgi:hypothetical protein
MIYKVIRYIISYLFTTHKKFHMARGVDRDKVAISTETYEIMGRKVSSLLGDQDQEGSFDWVSTLVITYSFCILNPFLYFIFET